MIQKENNREIKYKDTEVGRIPEHWDVVRLGDVCEIIMGQSPKSEHYNLEGEGLPFLQGNRTFKRKYAAYDTFSSIYSRSAPKDSILMSVRAPVGAVNMVNTEIAIGRGLCAINCKEECNEYIYYSLICNKERILSKQTGTVYGSINKNDVHNLLIPYPPLIERKKTAKILSDIDNKIETNNKISQTLETMAQTLFNEWFVEFNFPDANGNPYKKSGGKMVKSEMGEIPEGWEVSSLSKVANYLNGLAMQKYRPKVDEESYPVLKIKELNQGNTTENSDRCAIDIPDKYVVNQGDIIFSWSGTLLVDIWSGETAGLNQHLFKVTSEKFPKWYYYLWTKYHLEKFIGIAKNKATTMGHINRGELDNSFVLVPVENQILMFSKVLSSKIDELIIVKKQDVFLKRIQKNLAKYFLK